MKMSNIEIPQALGLLMVATGLATQAKDGVLDLTDTGLRLLKSHIARESCRVGSHDFQIVAGVCVCRRPGCRVQVLA